jgi:hypothetical protein
MPATNWFKRALKVDKVSTAMGTDDRLPRAYRHGYGILDGMR